MRTDPWAGIKPQATALTGTRVESSHPRDWWWCVDPSGRPALALYLVSVREVPADLSELKDLSISFRKQNDGSGLFLLVLNGGGDTELFQVLCEDLVENTAKTNSPDEAVEIAFTRLRRWHDLLRRGKRPGLTEEEVRGLIAELLFLKEEMIPKLGIANAIRSWVGPLGHPQDFAFEKWAFEIKSRLVSTRQIIEISSLDQLESNASVLLLVVQDLLISQNGASGSFTLASTVSLIRESAHGGEPDIGELFEKALIAVGYEDGRRYAEAPYAGVNRRYFKVEADFPRLMRSATQPEIIRARYAVDINQCARFKVAEPWV
jgi:hypothetical protein